MMKRKPHDTELLIQIAIAFFVLMAVVFKYQSSGNGTQKSIEAKGAASLAAFDDLQEAQARGRAQDYHQYEADTEGAFATDTARDTASDISDLAKAANAASMTASFDSELDSRSLNDLEYENARERDFLLNVVGVSRDEYRMIQHRRRNTRWQIRHAEEIAKEKGLRPEEVKAAAINNYIYWMQSLIGVGYYSQLQEVVNGTEQM